LKDWGETSEGDVGIEPTSVILRVTLDDTYFGANLPFNQPQPCAFQLSALLKGKLQKVILW
jgi:hypothetical protein